MSNQEPFIRSQVLTCCPRAFSIFLMLVWAVLLLHYPATPLFGQATKKVSLNAFQIPNNQVVLPQPSFYIVTSHPSDSFRLYAATPRGLHISENRGRSWHATPINGSQEEIFSVAVHPVNPEILYAGRRDGLWKSENGGLNWGLLPHPNSVSLSIDVAQSQPTTLYSGTARNGVFKSTNQGNQWMHVSGGLPVARAGGRPEEIRTLVVDPRESDVVYVAFSQIGVYRTTDGGKRWDEFNKGIPIARPISPPQLAFDKGDPGRLFLVFSERIHSHLIKTRVYLLSNNERWVPLRVRFPDNMVPLALMVDGPRNVAQLWGPDGVWELPLPSRKK